MFVGRREDDGEDEDDKYKSRWVGWMWILNSDGSVGLIWLLVPRMYVHECVSVR